MPSTQTDATPTSTTSAVRVMGSRRLRLARYLWVLIFAVNLTYGLANWVVYTAGRVQPCTAEPCGVMQIPVDIALRYANSSVPFTAIALVRPILELIMVMAYTGVGLLIFWRRSRDWMGLLSGMALCLLGFQLTYSIETLPIIAPHTLPISLFLSSAMAVVTYTALYMFPNGQIRPRWSAIVMGITIAYEVLRGVFINIPQLGVSPGAMLIGTLVLCVFGFGLLRWRYRLLNQTERQQIKWLVLAFGWLVIGLTLSIAQRSVLPGMDTPLYPTLSLLAIVVQHTLYLALPLAFAFSMLRYRLWDADLVINRSLVYISSFITLGVLVFVLSLVLNAILANVTEPGSRVPFWVSVVVAIALFPWVSHRLARFIDRQVYGFRSGLTELSKKSAAETYFVPTNQTRAGTLTGEKMGAYVLGALLGKGPMSEVYTATDSFTGQTVALKVLPDSLNAEFEALQRFMREARVLSQLSHPNIVKLVTSGMSDSLHYLALEWVGSQTLQDRLANPIPFDEAIGYLRDVASALDAAHAAGIIHRDVKPSNILLRAAGKRPQAVLSDFGVAKLHNDTAPFVEDGFVGTLYYAAPEQISSAMVVDHRADIYALGIVAYQLLTGQHPFKTSTAGVVFAQLNRPPTDPHVLRPDLPQSARAALLKALAKSPAQRFETAGKFTDALWVDAFMLKPATHRSARTSAVR